ncbi:MAG: DsbA family oxidoreductase [Acidimicrobiia bacterium]
MLVEIYSDVVCPWCYIGQHQFRIALERSPHAPAIEVGWRAFQLDPRAKPEPTPVWDAYVRKFGGEDAAAAVIARLTGAAAGVGLEIRLDRALRVNTFDAHRLVWWVGDGPRQWDLEQRLMEAYFVDGRNVAEHATLVELAEAVGCAPGEVERFLVSREGVAEVQSELATAADRDVLGVPTYFFASQVGIPGAQDPDTFLKIIDRAFTRLTTSGSDPGR